MSRRNIEQIYCNYETSAHDQTAVITSQKSGIAEWHFAVNMDYISHQRLFLKQANFGHRFWDTNWRFAAGSFPKDKSLMSLGSLHFIWSKKTTTKDETISFKADTVFVMCVLIGGVISLSHCITLAACCSLAVMAPSGIQQVSDELKC